MNFYKWLRNPAQATESLQRNANVDGSSTPVVFEWAAPDGYETYWERVIVHLQDSGTFDADKYGNGLSLTNGIKVQVVWDDGTEVLDLIDGHTIIDNGDWEGMCYDFSYNSIGVGDNVAAVRWTVAKAGKPIKLEPNQRIRVTIQDDLTGLTKHRFNVQGYYE